VAIVWISLRAYERPYIDNWQNGAPTKCRKLNRGRVEAMCGMASIHLHIHSDPGSRSCAVNYDKHFVDILLICAQNIAVHTY
jgi:hypothetical protein